MEVDFSGFEWEEIKRDLRALNNMCKLYMFTTSDPIYDVCDPKIRREGFIKETHSIRPENKKMVEELNDEEEYRNDMLKCEAYLISHVNLEEFPYVSLTSWRDWFLQSVRKILGPTWSGSPRTREVQFTSTSIPI